MKTKSPQLLLTGALRTVFDVQGAMEHRLGSSENAAQYAYNVERLRVRDSKCDLRPDFAERGLGQEAQALGTFRVARVDDGGNEEERKKSYTATRTECFPLPPNPPKFSRGLASRIVDACCDQLRKRALSDHHIISGSGQDAGSQERLASS